MKTIICICNNKNCNKQFEKPLNEYKRILKNKKLIFCSRNCAGYNNLKNFGDKRNTIPPVNTYKANPFKYYIRNCKRRLKDFDLTLEYLEELWNTQQGLCAYTKIPLTLNTHSISHDFRISASIDRKDSTKGYIQGNVQFVSTAINYMKSTMTHEQTIEFLHTIFQMRLQFPEG